MEQQEAAPHPTGQDDNDAAHPHHLRVTIVTGDRVVYDGLADRVIAPAINGQISVLPRHAPLLATLEPGEMVVRLGDYIEAMAVGGGFIEVLDDQVTVLADTAERAEEIDTARAEAARQRARALMRMYRDRPEYAAAYQAMRRSRARLKVASRMVK